MSPPRLTTAVIGAGPAGLLFIVVGVLLARRAGVGPDAWAIVLYDKRDRYMRSHRLRMAPEAYLAIQREVDDPRFDAFIEVLQERDFSPEVNVVEERLLALVDDLGVKKEKLSLGDGPEEASLDDLRRRLGDAELLGPDTGFTVVAADSVHSVVRDWVRGDLEPQRKTHEQLARLRVDGPGLSKRLGAIDQLRLSKVLGSVVDYRLNANGFAEVDLFLTPREHALVGELGASPSEPVLLSSGILSRVGAPLFRAIVEHLEHGPNGARREVRLTSTFRLEHAVMPRLTFRVPSIGATVFLVGDAGISLPFQRGMSALAGCARSLAKVHVEWLGAANDDARAHAFERYDGEAHAIVEQEIAVVRSRAQIVGTLREIVRLSSLLPFPIQSWWLRAPDHDRRSDRWSIWFWSNVAVASLALGAASLAFAIGLAGDMRWLAPAGVSLGVQALGGVVYHAALAFEGGPHRFVRRVWEVQIAASLVGGVGAAIWCGPAGPGLVRLVSSVWWLVLGASFVAGLYAFARVVSRWFLRAGLRFEDA